MKENWKDIPGYTGIYMVSNLGNVKSFHGNEKLLNINVDKHGYCTVQLYKNSKRELRKVHRLVAECFLGLDISNKKIVVNHIDYNKENNNIDNLELVSQRYNTAHGYKNKNIHSKYTGVSYSKRDKKWISYITVDNKLIGIGRFIKEEDASDAYQNYLKTL